MKKLTLLIIALSITLSIQTLNAKITLLIPDTGSSIVATPSNPKVIDSFRSYGYTIPTRSTTAKSENFVHLTIPRFFSGDTSDNKNAICLLYGNLNTKAKGTFKLFLYVTYVFPPKDNLIKPEPPDNRSSKSPYKVSRKYSIDCPYGSRTNSARFEFMQVTIPSLLNYEIRAIRNMGYYDCEYINCQIVDPLVGVTNVPMYRIYSPQGGIRRYL